MAARKVPAKKAAPRKTSVKSTSRRPVSLTVDRLSELEDQFATLTWLHAELSQFIKQAVAQQVKQALLQSPALDQAIMNKLNGGA